MVEDRTLDQQDVVVTVRVDSTPPWVFHAQP
jgi:hypothetical protein